MLKLGLVSSTLAALLLAAACGGSPAATSVGKDQTDTTAAKAPEVQAKVAPASTAEGQFVLSGRMTDGRKHHRSTLMTDGRVLVAGGVGKGYGSYLATRHDTVSIWDPTTSEFTDTANMAKRREEPMLNALDDGRVFVAGGGGFQRYEKTTEIWDPATEKWTLGPKMASRKYQGASAKLQDGRIFIVGGTNDFFAPITDTEIFDPTDDTITAVAPLTQRRALHTATLLQDGRVLVVGGGQGGAGTEPEPLTSGEIWDPDADAWTATGELAVGHARHTATLLSDGRVLVTGGVGKTPSAELYDPATNEWTRVSSMSIWRAYHAAWRLEDGRILVSGGLGKLDSTEIFDPATGSWTPGPSMTEPRYIHTVTPLGDGRVLLVGGQTEEADNKRRVSNVGELYSQ